MPEVTASGSSTPGITPYEEPAFGPPAHQLTEDEREPRKRNKQQQRQDLEQEDPQTDAEMADADADVVMGEDVYHSASSSAVAAQVSATVDGSVAEMQD